MYYWNGQLHPGAFGGGNQSITVLNQWQKPGDNNPIQRFSTTQLGMTVNQTQAAYGDASYMRLKNVSLLWQAPISIIKKLGLQTASLYFRGQNLMTVTSYSGLDPETMTIGTLPPLQMWTIGGQFGF